MADRQSIWVIVVSVRDLLLQGDPDRGEDHRIGTEELDQGQYLLTGFEDAHSQGQGHDRLHITDQGPISHRMLQAMYHHQKHLARRAQASTTRA